MGLSSNIYLEERGNSAWLKHLMVGANSPNNDTWSEVSCFLYFRTEMQNGEPAM